MGKHSTTFKSKQIPTRFEKPGSDTARLRKSRSTAETQGPVTSEECQSGNLAQGLSQTKLEERLTIH
eukprot:3084139-Rhodomonas_salina.1